LGQEITLCAVATTYERSVSEDRRTLRRTAWTDRDSRNGWMKTPRGYELDLRLSKLHDVWSKIDAQLEENCLLLTVGLALARATTESWHEVAWSAAGGVGRSGGVVACARSLTLALHHVNSATASISPSVARAPDDCISARSPPPPLKPDKPRRRDKQCHAIRRRAVYDSCC